MRGRFAGQDEIAAGGLDGLGDRLTGHQIVREKHRAQMGQRRTMACQPALHRVALAILLLRPVLRSNEFRRQRQDMLVARRDDAGAEERVEIFGAAVRTLAARAPRAMDLARAMIFGAIQRDEAPPAEALERGEHTRCLDRLHEQRIEGRRRGTVQHLADVVVAGNGGDAEQGLAVRAPLPLRQGALVRQEGRAAHEEQRERGQADVGHRVGAGRQRPFAPVGQTGTDRAQRRDACLKGVHTPPESRFAVRRKPISRRAAPSEAKTQPVWQLRLTGRDRPDGPPDATQSH